MARTGPQKYPPALRGAHWYQDTYGGDAMESNVGVVHTTEGTSVPGYGGGASAPNFTALPDIGAKRLRWYQHFDFDTSSRALMNLRGGVETNTLNAVQIELVGTCDPRYRTSWGGRRAGRDYLYWPDAPDWALAELARFVRWAHDEHGVQLRSTVTWRPYPSSYGAHADRLTGSQWQGYYGWLGHQHVPENSHGDPGDLDFERVLEHARGTATEEDDMPTVEEIVKGVAKKDGIFDVPARWRESNPTNKQWQLESILAFLGDRTLDNRDDIRALSAKVDALAEKVAVLDVSGFTEALESLRLRLDVTPEG